MLLLVLCKTSVSPKPGGRKRASLVIRSLLSCCVVKQKLTDRQTDTQIGINTDRQREV